MRYLAWLVALLAVAAGLAGIIAPGWLLSLRTLVATQGALLVIAVLRIAIGVVLIMVAPSSRAPKALQIAGAVALFAGLATPFFGVERTRAVLAWEATQSPMLIRAGGAVALALGAFLTFALSRPRPARV